MLEKAVVAVEEDKAKALEMFNKGEGGFKDRDLYVWCANASDGIVTAQPYVNKGKQLRDLKGSTVLRSVNRGNDKRDYLLVAATRRGRALREGDFLHEGGDQICGVGYYKK